MRLLICKKNIGLLLAILCFIVEKTLQSQIQQFTQGFYTSLSLKEDRLCRERKEVLSKTYSEREITQFKAFHYLLQDLFPVLKEELVVRLHYLTSEDPTIKFKYACEFEVLYNKLQKDHDWHSFGFQFARIVGLFDSWKVVVEALSENVVTQYAVYQEGGTIFAGEQPTPQEFYLFIGQKGKGIWRAHKFDGSIPQLIHRGQIWQLFKNSLYVVDPTDAQKIQIFTDVKSMTLQTPPDDVQDIGEPIIALWAYTMREIKEKKNPSPDDNTWTNRLLVSLGRKNYYLKMAKMPYDRLPKPIILGMGSKIVKFLPINSYDHIKDANKKVLQSWTGNYLMFLGEDGSVELVRYALKIEDQLTIRKAPSPPDSIVVRNADPILFLRFDDQKLLFLNTGTSILRADLTKILFRNEKMKEVDFDLLPLPPAQREITDMLFFSPFDQGSYLLFYKKRVSMSSIRWDSFTYDLSTGRILKTSIAPDLPQKDLQYITLDWRVDDTGRVKNGLPLLRAFIDDDLAVKSRSLTVFEAHWLFAERKFADFTYRSIDTAKGTYVYPFFTWPISDFNNVNPNQRKHHTHAVMGDNTFFVMSENSFDLMFNTITHSNTTFMKIVTNTHNQDYIFTGNMQREYFCWAAAAVSIVNFYNKNDPSYRYWSQCEIASERKSDDCCRTWSQTSEKCISKGSSVRNTLEEVFHYSHDQVKSFSFPLVKQEINNNHIMVATKTTTHAQLIVGYAQDPSNDNSGMDWIITWNPSALLGYHGIKFVLFDHFSADWKSAITRIRVPSSYHP